MLRSWFSLKLKKVTCRVSSVKLIDLMAEVTYEDHFFPKVNMKRGECWEWQGSLNNRGYGVIKWQGRPVLAHRFSYFYSHAKIVELFRSKEVIRHTCDNKRCVRPSHLISGTHIDNMQDEVVRKKVIAQLKDTE